MLQSEKSNLHEDLPKEENHLYTERYFMIFLIISAWSNSIGSALNATVLKLAVRDIRLALAIAGSISAVSFLGER